MRLTVVMCALALAGCAGPVDEPRLSRLSDGAYEMAFPQTTANTIAVSQGMPVQAFIAGRAQHLCPNGYRTSDGGLRKRKEYADPEQVWRIDCE